MMVMNLDDIVNLPPLTEEDLKIIENARALPTEDCPELSSSELRQFRPWYDREKQPVTLNMNINTVSYYKKLAADTGVPYQELMGMYLAQCANDELKPVFG